MSFKEYKMGIIDDEYVCINRKSDYCAEQMSDDDYCAEWEKKR